MRTTRLTTTLEAPADTVFAAVTTPSAFRLVTRGLVDWRPARGRHDTWREGEERTGWLLVGGVLPISRHRLRVERLDADARLLRSDEGGGPIRSWRHDIHVEPIDARTCRYTDVIEIDAGPLTAVVWAFAEGFYRIRQRRWRELARVLGAAGLTPAAPAGPPA
ncbi:MAG TPA: hypothetical protein VK866_03080, partial [Acidimicrobiales bacterium]|nr:hypothetical protein [Acidimicrobiales bacterium]